MIKNTTYDSELIGHDLEQIIEDSDIQSILDGHNSSIEIVNPEQKGQTKTAQSNAKPP